MDIMELLKGRKINYLTEALVPVRLEIREVRRLISFRPLEVASKENDWWPRTETLESIEIEFTNGFKRKYKSLFEIDFVSDTKEKDS